MDTPCIFLVTVATFEPCLPHFFLQKLATIDPSQEISNAEIKDEAAHHQTEGRSDLIAKVLLTALLLTKRVRLRSQTP